MFNVRTALITGLLIVIGSLGVSAQEYDYKFDSTALEIATLHQKLMQNPTTLSLPKHQQKDFCVDVLGELFNLPSFGIELLLDRNEELFEDASIAFLEELVLLGTRGLLSEQCRKKMKNPPSNWRELDNLKRSVYKCVYGF